MPKLLQILPAPQHLERTATMLQRSLVAAARRTAFAAPARRAFTSGLVRCTTLPKKHSLAPVD